MTRAKLTREKQYLGDGVYIQLDERDCVVLTTEDGVAVTNRIVLEGEVFTAAMNYVISQLGKRMWGLTQ